MATESKRMQQLRGTASAWTSANTVLRAGEIGIETNAGTPDTWKFKIGDGTTAWNSLSYHTHAWGDITGKPSTFTPAAHNQDASTITTGTMATARLGSGTADSSVFLRGDQSWAAPSGDRGFWYDVRSYGASVTASAADNTAAFQDAVDAAATQSGGYGGGTVYIPANEMQDATMWDLDSPVWLHGSNIRIMGEGSQSTCIRSVGPAFVVSKHPRFWSVSKTTYASDSSSTTGTVSGATNWINVSKCKVDLHDFRSAGAFPPTNGNPEFAPARVAALGAGYWFGIRSQRGVAQGRYPYCSMATGDKTQTNQTADLWPFHSKITWEFVVYHHEAVLCGGIAGAGNIGEQGSGPDPWILFGAGSQGDPGNAKYIFDLALTDKNFVNRTWCRFTVPQNTTVGIHRIAIQFDPDNATEADRLIVWVDRVKATVTTTNLVWYYGGNYNNLDTTYNGSGTGLLWNTYNRVARWTESDFSVCAESIKTAVIASEQQSNLSDYTVAAAAVYATNLYTNASTQTKVGGGGADDSYVFPIESSGAYNTNANRIGAMTNEYAWSPNSDTNLNVNLLCRGRAGDPVWGFLCPKGSGNWGGYAAINSPAIEGLRIRQYNAFPVSCGIYNGPFINSYRLDDIELDQGFYASIGAMWNVASYWGKWTNLRPAKMVHVIHSIIHGQGWDFGFPNVCAIRATGSELSLDRFSFTTMEGDDEGFCIATSGGSIGAGLTFTTGTINQEGLIFAPLIATFYLQKNYAHGNNSLILDGIQTGETSAPMIYLDDLNWQDRRSTNVQIKRAGFAAFGSNVVVRGPDWHGTFDTSPELALAEQVNYLEPVSGQSYCDLKSIDTSSYGLPSAGGYVNNANEIHVRNPAPGAVARWRSRYASNAVVYEGTNSPPNWDPIEFADSGYYPNALSANIYPGIHATCTLPWPSGGDTTTLAFTGLTLPWSRVLLASILAGATSPTRSHIDLRWGYTNLYPSSISYSAGFFYSASTANSGIWASAASGSKATNATIATSGMDPDGNPAAAWNVRQRRRWTWALMLGDNTTRTPLFVGRTNVREPANWVVTASDTATVASGGLIVKRATRVGNWTHYASNKIIDWMFGGTLGFGGPWYFGLCKGADTTLGTITGEPSTGSYARVSVAMNSTNWDEWFDSGFYANKTAITFPDPTADWGRMTHWLISDASSGGNIIACGVLNRPVRVFDGDTAPSWRPGAFQVQL